MNKLLYSTNPRLTLGRHPVEDQFRNTNFSRKTNVFKMIRDHVGAQHWILGSILEAESRIEPWGSARGLKKLNKSNELNY